MTESNDDNKKPDETIILSIDPSDTLQPDYGPEVKVPENSGPGYPIIPAQPEIVNAADVTPEDVAAAVAEAPTIIDPAL
jgi:hypothetical protein